MRAEMHTELWWGNPEEGDRLEDLSVGTRIILTFLLKI
jgi:hypothetical protein